MAGAANAFNMAYDCDIDRIMQRTATRPVAAGRVSAREAYVFSAALLVVSVVILGLFVNLLTAGLALAGYIIYTLVYTRWLKRTTPMNVLIGGTAGSIPPLIGWTAVTGSLTPMALWLFLIITVWQEPHFWALAILKHKDYENAHIPMLPVVKGDAETIRQIWLYTLSMVLVTLLLPVIGQMGWVYFVGAVVLNINFVINAYRLRSNQTRPAALRVYVFSLIYLALLFALMVADRIVYLKLT
jgi:protoheme IX farnesyltransferase